MGERQTRTQATATHHRLQLDTRGCFLDNKQSRPHLSRIPVMNTATLTHKPPSIFTKSSVVCFVCLDALAPSPPTPPPPGVRIHSVAWYGVWLGPSLPVRGEGSCGHRKHHLRARGSRFGHPPQHQHRDQGPGERHADLALREGQGRYGSIVAHRKPRDGPKGACPPNSRFKRCGSETRAGVHLVLRGTAVNSSVGELLVRVWCLQRDYCQRDC